MSTFTTREQIIEMVHKLFIYTDIQQWEKLQQEVFTEQVLFNMTAGTMAKMMTAGEICDSWSKGFTGIDAII